MIKRVVIFYVTTFVLTVILGGLQQVTGIGGSTFILPQWAPGIAALLMLLLFRKDGISLRPVVRRADWPRYVAALVLPLVVAPLLFLPVNRAFGPLDAGAAVRALTPIWLAGMLFGALGEELGWRGYLQPLLRPRLGAFAVSLLVGSLWALWHVQLWTNGPLYMLFLGLTLIGYSLVITALIDDAPGGRLVTTTLFHLAINVGNVIFLGVLSETGFMALNSAVWLAVAAVAVLLRRERFFGQKQLTNYELRTTSYE